VKKGFILHASVFVYVFFTTYSVTHSFLPHDAHSTACDVKTEALSVGPSVALRLNPIVKQLSTGLYSFFTQDILPEF